MTCQVANARTSRRCSGESRDSSRPASHCSARVSSSSRGGRTPPAVRTCRRNPAARGRGCSSSASWVAAVRPAAISARMAAAGALAQPVQRAARVAGCADRLEHGAHRRGNVPGRARQDLRGAPSQAAPGAQFLFVELVLGAAAGAGGHDGQPGAVRAGDGVRAGREDQAPFLPAARAPGPAAERGRVAGVADRAFGPSCLRRPVLPASGAGRGRLRRARRAERAAAAGEVAGTVPAAADADGVGQPVAVDAGVRFAVMCPDRDGGFPPAVPAGAMSPGVPAAPLADGPAGGVAARDRLDLAAVSAGGRADAGGACLAHAPARCPEQRPAVPAAPGAGRHREDRPAGDELGGQPPGHRGRAVPEHARIGGQRRGQLPKRGRGRGHLVDRVPGHARGQRPVRRDDVPDQRVPPALRAGRRLPGAAGKHVAGRAAGRHRAPGPGMTRARTGRGRCAGSAAVSSPSGPACAPARSGRRDRSPGCRTMPRGRAGSAVPARR